MTTPQFVSLLGLVLSLPPLSQVAGVDSRELAQVARQIIERAVVASGGLERLHGIQTVTIEEVGTHQWVHQSRRATSPWRQGERDEVTVLDRNAARLMIRTRVTHPEYYCGWSGATVTGETGFTLDHYSRMAAPVARTSVEAYRSHLYQRLPHEAVLDALARAVSLRYLGRAPVAGRAQEVVSYVSFDGRQTTLYLDAATSLLTQFEVLITNPVEGDGAAGVRFADYRSINGVMTPSRREQYRGTEWVIRTDYRVVQFNAAIDAAAFEVPADYQRVAAIAIPQPEIIEVGEGLFFLRGLGGGGRYNVMFASFGDHIVVFNAPAPVAVTEQAIEFITKKTPDKPIRAVVLTHPAYDHVAGVRAFVARGTTVIARPQTRALLERIVTAPFSLEPDTLARAPRAPRFEDIGRRHELTDGKQRVELIDIGPDETGEDVLIAYFPAARLIFQADLVNPNYAGTIGKAQPPAVMLEKRLTDLGLNVLRIAGGHGGIVDRDVLRRSVSLAVRETAEALNGSECSVVPRR